MFQKRFKRQFGPLRPTVGEAADRFLACGVIEHSSARIFHDEDAHECLVAFKDKFP